MQELFCLKKNYRNFIKNGCQIRISVATPFGTLRLVDLPLGKAHQHISYMLLKIFMNGFTVITHKEQFITHNTQYFLTLKWTFLPQLLFEAFQFFRHNFYQEFFYLTIFCHKIVYELLNKKILLLNLQMHYFFYKVIFLIHLCVTKYYVL